MGGGRWEVWEWVWVWEGVFQLGVTRAPSCLFRVRTFSCEQQSHSIASGRLFEKRSKGTSFFFQRRCSAVYLCEYKGSKVDARVQRGRFYFSCSSTSRQPNSCSHVPNRCNSNDTKHHCMPEGYVDSAAHRPHKEVTERM